METNLKITVKNCGKAVGTLGWFNAEIKDSEIIIKPCKTGEPALWLHKNHKKDGTENKENEGNTWICGAQKPLFELNDYGYHERGNYMSIYVIDNQYQIGFTGYALTPACKTAISEFIDQCVDQFAEWFEQQ
jgi:hypothetical protein